MLYSLHNRAWLLRVTLATLVSVGFIVLTGCGNRGGTITGKVTFDGEPLKGGSVTFMSDNGNGGGTVDIQEDGTYAISGILAGSYKITVETESMNVGGGSSNRPMMGGRPGMKGKGMPKENTPGKAELPGDPSQYGYKMANPGEMKKRYTKIPDKYNDPASSGLTYQFPGGEAEHTITLTK